MLEGSLCPLCHLQAQSSKSQSHCLAFPLSLSKSGAQLSPVLGDHPDFHIPEDRGGAEGAGGFSCSAQIK